MIYSERKNYGAMLVTDEGERMGLNDINAMNVQMLDDDTLENATPAAPAQDDELHPTCGNFLEEVTLPDSLRVIGLCLR